MKRTTRTTRHFIIPDRQAKPNVPLVHNRWIGLAIKDYQPDIVMDLGDNADFPSMSQHQPVGHVSKEGQRLLADFNAARDADRILEEAMGKFKPTRMIRLRGNHEYRLQRYLDQNPVLIGMIDLDMLHDKHWEIIDYIHGAPGIIYIDGIAYAHYFANPNNGKPVCGTVHNRLAHIGMSFVQGHQQGLQRGNRQYATGKTGFGMIAGSCYIHDEEFKGNCNTHWRGIVVLNEVRDGEYCEMPLSLDYLCRRYEGMPLARYLRKNYRDAARRFTLAQDD